MLLIPLIGCRLRAGTGNRKYPYQTGALGFTIEDQRCLTCLVFSYSEGDSQKAPHSVLVSELGSLSLEFTKLSQLTGDMKYYDAIQRISDEFEKSQDSTKLPGLFPIIVDASKPSFVGDNAFTLGGMADSLYEYVVLCADVAK